MNKTVFIIFFISLNLYAQCVGWVGKAPSGAYCWSGSYKVLDKKNIEILVDVYGFPQNKPTVTFEHRYLKLISKKDIPNRLGVINFTRYRYIMKKNKKDGWLRIKDNNIVKKSILIKSD